MFCVLKDGGKDTTKLGKEGKRKGQERRNTSAEEDDYHISRDRRCSWSRLRHHQKTQREMILIT